MRKPIYEPVFKCFFTGIFLILFHLTYAQETNTPTIIPLDPLLKKAESRSILDVMDFSVSTTDRINQQKSSRAPATISIITEEQIALRGYQSLLDVLRDVYSIKIDYGVDPRWMNDVSMRGIRGMDHLIILLDGIRISSPTNDIIPVMENYPVHFAKQIEIVFGPASALYGADAFSGVINIVSKKSMEVNATEISVNAGMYNEISGNLLTSQRVGSKVDFLLAAQYHYDQQPKLSYYYPNEYEEGLNSLKNGVFNTILGPMSPTTPFSPQQSQTPLSAYGIMSKLNIYDLTLTYFGNKSINPSTQANTPNNAVYNRGAFFGHAINMLSGVYQKAFDHFKTSTIVTGSYYLLDPQSNFRNVFTGLNPAYLYSRGSRWKGEQLFSYRLDSKLSLTSGITYERFFSIPRGHDLQYPVYSKNPKEVPIVNSIAPLNPEGITVELPRIEFTNFGTLFQIRYDPIREVSFTLGGRYDNNSRFGDTFNPRLGVVWDVTSKITIKGLYGTAFLAPSAQAAFDQFGTFSTDDQGLTYRSSFFRLPNPDLAPKNIETTELSLITTLLDDFRVQATGFYTRINGLFKFVPDEGNTNRYNGMFQGWPVDYIEVTVNQGNQINYGGSLVVDYFKQLSRTSKVNAYFSLSLIDGIVEADASNESDTEITSVTPLMFHFGGDLIYPKFSISPRVIITGKQGTFELSQQNPLERQKLDGFVLINVNSNIKLSNKLYISVGVENLLDQRYRNVNLGASPEQGTAGAASVEFANGAPQNPIRITTGLKLIL